MSQEKVDRRKAAKANRKKQNVKDKRKRLLGKIGLAVIVLALLVWIGYSVVSMVKGDNDEKKKEVNLDSLQDYMEEVEDEVDGTDEDEDTDASGTEDDGDAGSVSQ